MASHYNLNIFKFSASRQNCTHPAFWPAARVRRTSVFTAGENLGAGAALPTPSIEIPKGGDRLRRSESKTKGHPFGCPFVLEVPPRFELGSGAFAELCLTTWLWHRLEQKLLHKNGASDEARTRYLHLGKVALYQMSYTRMLPGRGVPFQGFVWLVPPVGIEPTTRGFSVLCSTN